MAAVCASWPLLCAQGRSAVRPNATSVVPICHVRFTSIRDMLKRLKCANTGHSPRTCRTGQIDPESKFFRKSGPAVIRRKAEIPGSPASHMSIDAREPGHERPPQSKSRIKPGAGRQSSLSPWAAAPRPPALRHDGFRRRGQSRSVQSTDRDTAIPRAIKRSGAP
jgi:hypothetical protein